jgi:hypothetical protein
MTGGMKIWLLAFAAALAGCSTYSVRRSALAPHIAPPMRSGHGMGDASAEAAFGASALASTARPAQGDEGAGLHIPSVELGGALRGRLTDYLDAGLLIDYGMRQGATSTSDDQPTPKNGSVMGAGASLFLSVPTASPALRLGVGLDLMAYSIPYVEYRTCIENCAGHPYTTVDEDRETIGVYSLSLVPSWRVGRVTLFGGGTVRNHPTIDKGSVQGEDLDLIDDVEPGPLNLVVSAGAELELGAGVRAMGLVYQPLTADPVDYAPTFGVALTVPLGRRAPARPPVTAMR